MVGFGNEKLSVRKSIPRLSRFEESLVAGVLLRTTHLAAIQAPLMGHSLEIEKKKEKKGDSFEPPFFYYEKNRLTLDTCLYVFNLSFRDASDIGRPRSVRITSIIVRACTSSSRYASIVTDRNPVVPSDYGTATTIHADRDSAKRSTTIVNTPETSREFNDNTSVILFWAVTFHSVRLLLS